MKSHLFKSTCVPVLALVVSVLCMCCTNTLPLVGAWREIGKTATLEFSEDGSFRAVDNEGMAVKGNYALLENGRVRFEILHPSSTPEIVILEVSVTGDDLTIAAEHPEGVERYKRLER